MDQDSPRANYANLVEQRRGELRRQFARILPANASVIWEIGCGHGHFLTSYAACHSDRLCIGIDLATERIARALRKRDRAKLPNLHFLQADAGVFLEAIPADVSFADIFVLFPDPWPKARHHKHRLMQFDFLAAVARRSGRDARLLFRTDYEPYYDDVSRLLSQHPGWSLVDEPWPFEFETVFQSRAARYGSLVARARPPAP